MRHFCLSLFLATFGFAQSNDALQTLFRDYYEASLKASPESATAAGRKDLNDRWSDYSPKATESYIQSLESFQKRLAPFKSAQLGAQDRLSVELLDYELRSDIEETKRTRDFGVVNHFRGPHLGVFSIMEMAPSSTVKDYEDRIARIRATATLVDGMVAASESARGKGLIPPGIIVDRLLKQLDTQASQPADKTPLLNAFRAMPSSISPADKQRLQKSAAEAYTNAFQPAWRKYRTYVADAYSPKPRKSISTADLPDGKSLYTMLVQHRTTTSFTPEQIHEIGKREVTRIEAEMAAIRKELSFNGTHEEFVEKVLNAPERRFKTEPEILAHGRDIAKRIDPELARLFKKLPRMPYGVRPIPADRARTAAPYYQGPALDGSRAGNFFLRTADPETQSNCCMEALILHESVPGHHLQVALAREMENVPEFRRSLGYTAFAEGWGLYAESLGSDLGMYENAYERYGKLQSEYLRALRLITDTGLHHYGWTREQAVATMSKAKGGWINDEVVSSEVDRYIAIPGQALAYKMGELKIKELRAKAEKQLGSKFDIRDFHDVVLRNGSVPLTVLEQEVDRWLAGK